MCMRWKFFSFVVETTFKVSNQNSPFSWEEKEARGMRSTACVQEIGNTPLAPLKGGISAVNVWALMKRPKRCGVFLLNKNMSINTQFNTAIVSISILAFLGSALASTVVRAGG